MSFCGGLRINDYLQVWKINTRRKRLVAFSKIPAEGKYVKVSEWQAALHFLTRLLGILRNNSTSRYTAVNYSDVRCGGRERKWQSGDSSLIIVLLLWPLWNKWSYLSGSKVCWGEARDSFYLRNRNGRGNMREMHCRRNIWVVKGEEAKQDEGVVV